MDVRFGALAEHPAMSADIPVSGVIWGTLSLAIPLCRFSVENNSRARSDKVCEVKRVSMTTGLDIYFGH